MGLAEGEVGKGADGIEYDGVDSCLTVTVELEDGSYVGGHLSLYKAGSGLDSTQVLGAMKDLIAGAKATGVKLAGQLSTWNPIFLDHTIESGEAGGAFKGDFIDEKDMKDAVLDKLGLSGTSVSSEDKTGSFKVSL
jgi:hypothetical protein